MNEYFLFWKDVEWQQLQAEYYAKQAFCTLHPSVFNNI